MLFPTRSLLLTLLTASILYPAISVAQEESVDQEELLRAHNFWRSEVGVAGLRWSESLEVKAKKWADSLKENEGCSMVHSGPGENLYWASAHIRSSKKSGDRDWTRNRSVQNVAEKKVVDSWASEKDWYDYESNNCSPPKGETCGHYTQVIWEGSTEMGCGKAICADESQVWVCNYSPPGNIIGRKPY